MTLREQIEAELNRRETVVREVLDGIGDSPWVVEYLKVHQRITNARAILIAETFVGSPSPGHSTRLAPEAEHIAIHDPEDALRRYAAARRVLQRHEPINERPYRKTKCRHHAGAGVSWVVDWPCAEILDLADSLGISSEDGTQP